MHLSLHLFPPLPLRRPLPLLFNLPHGFFFFRLLLRLHLPLLRFCRVGRNTCTLASSEGGFSREGGRLRSRVGSERGRGEIRLVRI